MIEAVIFDMDGVLINTEPLHYQCWVEIFKERYGIDLDYEVYKPCIGSTRLHFMNLIKENYGITFESLEVMNQIMKEKKDEKGVLHEISDSTDTQKFAFLFEFDGDQKGIRRVLYNCTATRPSIESETKEDSIEPGTETITISNAPLPNGRVKAQTTVDTDDTVYSGWYKTV